MKALSKSRSLLSIVACTLTCLLSLASSGLAKTVYFNGKDFRGGYYIVPSNIPAGQKMWVMVDVHGAGGLRKEKAESVLSKLVAPEPVIVIVPSFTSGYQGGSGQWASQMIKNFKTVQKSYEVHNKMFVHGHSGGSQFAHRFAMNHPKYVVGVSAHSSGSWATGGQFDSISSSAKKIPFTISCGEKDTAYSVKGYPHTRIEWYKIFAKQMKKKGFVVATQTWPKNGHGVPPKLYGDSLKECFLLATKGEVPTSNIWSGDMEKIAEAARKAYGGSGKSSRIDDRKEKADAKKLIAVQKAQAAVAAGRAPSQLATLKFLFKHPASEWAAKEEFKELKEHCKKVAQQYAQERNEKGKPLKGKALLKFSKVTDGLGLDL